MKLLSNLVVIPFRCLRQRPANSVKSFPSIEELENECGLNAPERKFRDAFGHRVEEDYLEPQQPSPADEMESKKSEKKSFPYLQNRTHNHLKAFAKKSLQPQNHFTKRFHNQELLDFFNLEILNSKQLVEEVTDDNKYDLVRDRFAPLCNVPYEEQLQMKQAHVENIVRVLDDHLFIYNEWKCRGKPTHRCLVDDIKTTNNFSDYGNFTKLAVSGFPLSLGYYFSNKNIVAPPSDFPCIRSSHKLVIQHFENFLRSSHSSNVFSYHVDQVWKEFHIRSNSKGQIMIVGLLDADRLRREHKIHMEVSLTNYFTTGPGKDCGVSSILIRWRHKEQERDTYNIIYGPNHLIENVNDQSFIVEPDSVYQTNTEAAAILYDTIKDMAGTNEKTTILDLCCGSGVAGMQLAPHFQHVLGVDSNPKLIDLAKHNAEKNNLKNCSYFHGKLQELLPEMLGDLSQCDDVIAIVNAPQNGISSYALKFLRQSGCISKIIYVSWRPCFALANMCQLLKDDRSPDINPGFPFAPFRVAAIDTQPHTIYTHLVVLYQRLTQDLKRR